jgi:tetratricopeptide (TPR) repeat protein
MSLKLSDLLKVKTGEKPAPRQTAENLQAMAALALQSGQLQKAVQLYDAVIAANPNQAEPFYKRANAHNGLGQSEAALADYDRATVQKSGNRLCADIRATSGRVCTGVHLSLRRSPFRGRRDQT